MNFILFLTIALGIFGSINYYIGIRAYQYLGIYLPFLNSNVYWILFWFVATSFILGRFNIKFIPSFVRNTVNIVGGYWIAVMLYSLILLAFTDIILIILKCTGFKDLPIFKTNDYKLYIGILLLCSITIILVYGTYRAGHIIINTYNIHISKKTPSLKNLHVVFFSDSHLGNIIRNSQLKVIVEKVNELKPDLVLLGGDIIDDSIAPYIEQGMANTFREIKSTYGVYGIFGNHDKYGSKQDVVLKNFKAGNINILCDEYVKIADSLYIIGRDNASMEKVRSPKNPLHSLMKDIDKSLPLILLDHSPNRIVEAEDEGIDLQLSGHTHNGQFFPMGYITNRLFETDWGYYSNNNYQLLVTSGVGTWGSPIRIGTQSEILSINITFGDTNLKNSDDKEQRQSYITPGEKDQFSNR